MMLMLFILVPEGLLSGCYRAYLSTFLVDSKRFNTRILQQTVHVLFSCLMPSTVPLFSFIIYYFSNHFSLGLFVFFLSCQVGITQWIFCMFLVLTTEINYSINHGMIFGGHSGRPMYILHRPSWNQFVSSQNCEILGFYSDMVHKHCV